MKTGGLAGLVLAARALSSVFVDGYFGYESAPFQERWHQEWNRPAAEIVQWSPIEHGKTQQATGWAMHRLGQDPENTRLLWIGAAHGAAIKSVSVIHRAIETAASAADDQPSRFLRAVFPKLRPGDRWARTAFSVAGAKATEKDWSVEAVGVGGAILGGRFTDIVLDDTCTFQTTYTLDRREEMTRWVLSTVLGRLLPGGRIIVLGNAWYPDDLMHVLARRGFRVIKDEAYREDEAGRIIPESVLWPEQWPLERLEDRRRKLGTIEAMRQLRCLPYTAGQGRFRMEWFDTAMKFGSELTLVEQYDGRVGPAFGGVDIGVGQKEGNDPSALWVHALQKNGQRRLLNAREQRFEPGLLVTEIADWYGRYGGVWKVENNAAQEFLRQWAKTQGIPTRPHTTGKTKADPSLGIPGLAVELEQGMWVLPSGDEASIEMAIRWRSQCLAWAPGEHTGDLLMASWFAREGTREGMVSPGQKVENDTARADYRVRGNYERPAGLFRRQ